MLWDGGGVEWGCLLHSRGSEKLRTSGTLKHYANMAVIKRRNLAAFFNVSIN